MNINRLSHFIPSPVFDLIISIYNTYLYKVRHSGQYLNFKKKFNSYLVFNYEELCVLQQIRLKEFVLHCKENSPYYNELLNDVKVETVDDLKKISFLDKKFLINNLHKIQTVQEKDGVVSLTGGTTGASMKVVYTKEDLQERFAALDLFREKRGYSLGDRVAWFSGKSLISPRDMENNRFFKDDYINKIRFFSTFHITQQNAVAYLEAIRDFKPKYIVGFPSSVLALCHFAEELNFKLNHTVSVFFPTAETVTDLHRSVITRVLGCTLVDQYASSEGAPFIFECRNNKLHIDITTGVFEVIDKNGNESTHGELVVTSFSTRGTPLIRYKVGDHISLSSETGCLCGSNLPIATSIDGRMDDYLLSPDNGKVNLGNISNATKDVTGIISFQVIQTEISKLTVYIVVNKFFNDKNRKKLHSNFIERFGCNVSITFEVVDDIPTEKSGKFRMIKNMIKGDS